MIIKIYEPVKSMGQSAYTVRLINNTYAHDVFVPDYRIDRYISIIIETCKVANNSLNFKIKGNK